MTATLEAPVCPRHQVPMQQDPYRDGAGAARYVWRCPSMETIGTGRVPCNRAVRDDETPEEAAARWDRRHQRAIGRRQERLDAALPVPAEERTEEGDVKYTAEQREQVERLVLEEGVSHREAGKKSGVLLGSVHRLVAEARQRRGAPTAAPVLVRRTVSTERREQVATLLRQGMAQKEIVRTMRCRSQIVIEVRRELLAQGVELPCRLRRRRGLDVAPAPAAAVTALSAPAPTPPIQAPAVEEPMTWREPYAEPPLMRAAAILRQMSFGDLLRLEAEEPKAAAAVRAVALIGM